MLMIGPMAMKMITELCGTDAQNGLMLKKYRNEKELDCGTP
jgi:hypothetical protein